MDTNTITKKTTLKANRSRVWRALSDSAEFGSWFGMRVEGPFTPGARLKAIIVPTTVDPEVAAGQKPYEGTAFEITIVDVEPERLLSFQWHPCAIDEKCDYSLETPTLVSFTLEETPAGVLLTVSETGFDHIPLERRAKALSSNERGWEIQMTLIEKYLAYAPHRC